MKLNLIKLGLAFLLSTSFVGCSKTEQVKEEIEQTTEETKKKETQKETGKETEKEEEDDFEEETETALKDLKFSEVQVLQEKTDYQSEGTGKVAGATYVVAFDVENTGENTISFVPTLSGIDDGKYIDEYGEEQDGDDEEIFFGTETFDDTYLEQNVENSSAYLVIDNSSFGTALVESGTGYISYLKPGEKRHLELTVNNRIDDGDLCNFTSFNLYVWDEDGILTNTKDFSQYKKMDQGYRAFTTEKDAQLAKIPYAVSPDNSYIDFSWNGKVSEDPGREYYYELTNNTDYYLDEIRIYDKLNDSSLKFQEFEIINVKPKETKSDTGVKTRETDGVSVILYRADIDKIHD